MCVCGLTPGFCQQPRQLILDATGDVGLSSASPQRSVATPAFVWSRGAVEVRKGTT